MPWDYFLDCCTPILSHLCWMQKDLGFFACLFKESARNIVCSIKPQTMQREK